MLEVTCMYQAHGPTVSKQEGGGKPALGSPTELDLTSPGSRLWFGAVALH